MKRLHIGFLALMAALGASGSALAADFLEPVVPVEPMVVPEAFNWTGGYVGLNAGWALDNGNEHDLSLYGRGVRIDLSRFGSREYEGPFLGAQAGFNVQTGMIVLGIEGDIQWSSIDDRRRWDHTVSSDRFGDVAIHGEDDAEVNWFGTIRGRAGVAVNRALIYGTAGLAFAGVEDERRITFSTPGPGGQVFARAERRDSDDWRRQNGYALGGGVEYAFTNNVSVKAEYQYLDFNRLINPPALFGFGSSNSDITLARTVPGGKPAGFGLEEDRNSVDFHTVQVGANLRF